MVKTSCDNMLLGDLIRSDAAAKSSVVERKTATRYFRRSERKIHGKNFNGTRNQELLASEQIVYIDLGAEDNVKVGDYLTIYRPARNGKYC